MTAEMIKNSAREARRRRTRDFYLYLVEIIGVGVKVGITCDPKRRLAAHETTARVHGRSIGRMWVSAEPHANARANETAIRGGHTSEYLPRTFEDCMRQVETLTFEPVVAVDIENNPLNAFLGHLFPDFREWLKSEVAR